MKKFECLEVANSLVYGLKPLKEAIAKFDASLEEQMKKAAHSILLNLEESQPRVNRDRLNRRRIAAGSAAELRAALRIAVAWGYVAESDVKVSLELLDRVLAMLYRLTHARVEKPASP